MFHLYSYMLMMACHEDTEYQGIVLKRGQLLVGRNSLSANTGISAQSLRTCIERLKSTKEITIKSTHHFSIITITNYDLYNDPVKKSTNGSTSKSTNNQPTINQPSTTYEKVKNVDNVENKENLKESSILENQEEEQEERTESSKQMSEDKMKWNEYLMSDQYLIDYGIDKI